MLSQSAQAIFYLQQRESHVNREFILRTCNVIFIPNKSPASCREDLISERRLMHSYSDIFDEPLPCVFIHSFMTIQFFITLEVRKWQHKPPYVYKGLLWTVTIFWL